MLQADTMYEGRIENMIFNIEEKQSYQVLDIIREGFRIFFWKG